MMGQWKKTGIVYGKRIWVEAWWGGWRFLYLPTFMGLTFFLTSALSGLSIYMLLFSQNKNTFNRGGLLLKLTNETNSFVCAMNVQAGQRRSPAGRHWQWLYRGKKEGWQVTGPSLEGVTVRLFKSLIKEFQCGRSLLRRQRQSERVIKSEVCH